MSENYLSRLCLFVLVWALILIAFIWIIDPYGVSPIQLNLAGINTNKPKRLDIDRLIKPYEVWRYQPKTIFIGTSRIHQSMDPAVLDGTAFAPAYNAAIPASTLAENADNIEQFIKLDPHIKDIFIELFLYNFTGQQQTSSPKTWQQFMSNLIALQCSSDALFDAIQTLNSNRHPNNIPAHVAARGFRVPSSDFNPADTFNQSLFIHTVLSWDHAGHMNLQPEAFQSLDRIVAIAKEHGIKLHFLLTPNYPWDDYRLITLGYWPMLEAWLRKVSTYQDVVSFSQYNALTQEAPTHDPKMQWWNDPTHFSLKMGRLMLKTYLGKPDPQTPNNLMRTLTSKTVDAIIAERHRAALHWAATHPDFVETFADAKSLSDTVEGTLNPHLRTLVINGVSHPITSGVGEASFVDDQGSTLVVNGWAADDKTKKAVKQLIAVIGNRVVAQSYPTVDRPDITAEFKKKSLLSGYALSIPLQSWNGKEAIRVFAITRDGRAVQLTSKTKWVSTNLSG